MNIIQQKRTPNNHEYSVSFCDTSTIFTIFVFLSKKWNGYEKFNFLTIVYLRQFWVSQQWASPDPHPHTDPQPIVTCIEPSNPSFRSLFLASQIALWESPTSLPTPGTFLLYLVRPRSHRSLYRRSDLEDLFKDFGTIKDVYIPCDYYTRYEPSPLHVASRFVSNPFLS